MRSAHSFVLDITLIVFCRTTDQDLRHLIIVIWCCWKCCHHWYTVCVLSKSWLCPKQVMVTCSSFLCVLSVLQLYCHDIHQVGIHQHNLSTSSKWSDSVSDFLMMYHPIWVGDQESCLYHLGQGLNMWYSRKHLWFPLWFLHTFVFAIEV